MVESALRRGRRFAQTRPRCCSRQAARLRRPPSPYQHWGCSDPPPPDAIGQGGRASHGRHHPLHSEAQRVPGTPAGRVSDLASASPQRRCTPKTLHREPGREAGDSDARFDSPTSRLFLLHPSRFIGLLAPRSGPPVFSREVFLYAQNPHNSRKSRNQIVVRAGQRKQRSLHDASRHSQRTPLSGLLRG